MYVRKQPVINNHIITQLPHRFTDRLMHPQTCPARAAVYKCDKLTSWHQNYYTQCEKVVICHLSNGVQWLVWPLKAGFIFTVLFRGEYLKKVTPLLCMQWEPDLTVGSTRGRGVRGGGGRGITSAAGQGRRICLAKLVSYQQYGPVFCWVTVRVDHACHTYTAKPRDGWCPVTTSHLSMPCSGRRKTYLRNFCM